jgi:hypothetical protein
VLTRDELEFPFEGDVALEDMETGGTVISNARTSRAAYRAGVADFLERWRSRCARHGIEYTRVLTDVPPGEALRGYLMKRAAAGAR